MSHHPLATAGERRLHVELPAVGVRVGSDAERRIERKGPRIQRLKAGISHQVRASAAGLRAPHHSGLR